MKGGQKIIMLVVVRHAMTFPYMLALTRLLLCILFGFARVHVLWRSASGVL